MVHKSFLERSINDMKNIAVFNNSTGVVGVLESLLIGDVHMINASAFTDLSVTILWVGTSKRYKKIGKALSRKR